MCALGVQDPCRREKKAFLGRVAAVLKHPHQGVHTHSDLASPLQG